MESNPATIQLQIGDTLYTEGSWCIVEDVIADVTETEAITAKGLRFLRQHQDGAKPTNKSENGNLDHQYWYLVNRQAQSLAHYGPVSKPIPIPNHEGPTSLPIPC